MCQSRELRGQCCRPPPWPPLPVMLGLCLQRAGQEGLGHGAGGVGQRLGSAGRGEGLFVVLTSWEGQGSAESFCFWIFENYLIKNLKGAAE